MNRAAAQKRILLLGDARQVHLARWADYIASIGYEVLTVSLEPNERVPDPKHRIRLPRFLPPFVRYPLAVPATRRLIRDFAPHVVNAHFLPNYGVIAAMAGFSPWVLSAWGSDIMMLPQRSIFHMQRTRRVLRSAAFITSDAQVMSERLVELGAAPERVLTFPYGVDRKLFRPAAESSGAQGPRIISTRKLEAVYDIPTVLAAFQGLKHSLNTASLTVAGDGSLATPLCEKAATSPYRESIRFTGDVPHGDMPALLRGHDIYVSMSVSDTTSVSLLEAMACGLLPIVTDIPANREWIESGRNGLLVPVGDAGALETAMAAAWQDAALRKSASRANQAVVEERADWSENMSVVGALFDRLAGRA